MLFIISEGLWSHELLAKARVHGYAVFASSSCRVPERSEWFTAVMKFHYLYVLLSLKDNKLYIGSTNDLKRRTQEHNQGKNISTAKRLPVRLIFYEAYLTKSDAERRERYFKTNKGKTTLKQMLRDFIESSKG